MTSSSNYTIEDNSFLSSLAELSEWLPNASRRLRRLAKEEKGSCGDTPHPGRGCDCGDKGETSMGGTMLVLCRLNWRDANELEVAGSVGGAQAGLVSVADTADHEESGGVVLPGQRSRVLGARHVASQGEDSGDNG
jgi:hypothetical protein